MRRLFAFFLAISLLLFNTITVYACDEAQSNRYVTEIILGDSALSYESNDDLKLLLNALYLCCEQSDNLGQDEIDYLKSNKVSGLPALTLINIKNSELMECSHISWEHEYNANKKARLGRKRILQNTVNKVFDFGIFNNLFGSSSGKCNSFAAVLYYSHILSDYLADDPEETKVNVNGKSVSSYSGQPYIEINGGHPSFTVTQKKSTESSASFSPLDAYGRCGIAYAVLGADTMPAPNSRQVIGMIQPSGWNQEKYPGIVNSDPAYVFNRCHLIAHQLFGNDGRNNLITGTRYLNETAMKPLEDAVSQYIRSTGNHVLYRATPIFKGDNLLASGVQLEAYSVEDSGKGICFNYFCYNVQPGVDINYATGKNELEDTISNDDSALPFAVSNPSDFNPDLIYEMNKHLEILFEDQKSTGNYNTMMGDINTIAYEARSLGTLDEKPAQTYIKMKGCEYKYYQTLKMYVPLLLKNEKFFKSCGM